MSEPFKIVNCEDCVFYNPDPVSGPEVTVGHCQRFPPSGKLKANSVPNFASTLSNWWCGEGREGSK